MSTLPQPQNNPEELEEASSPKTSAETVVLEARRPTRFADPSFGDRLANARNLPPIQAPPPPPPPPLQRSGAGNLDVGLRGPSGGYHGYHMGRAPGFAPTAMNSPQYDQSRRWTHAKGSYRSPYDYPVNGHELGAHDLPRGPQARHRFAPEPTVHGRNIYPRAMPDHGTSFAGPSNRLETVPPIREETMAVQPPPYAQSRILLLGPLRLMRNQCRTKPDLKPLADFIDMYMADELHTVIERDLIIPNVAYLISIPMTEDHWNLYNQVLSRNKYPLRLHEMLARGKQEFDQFSGSTDPAVGNTLRDARNMLEYGTSTGLDLEGILTELVKANLRS